MTEFEKQDMFREKMIEDYKKGLYPQLSAFRDYFEWKMGGHLYFIRARVRAMLAAASDLLDEYYCKYPAAMDNLPSDKSDDIWQLYRGYGDDAYIVSYLESIDAELTNLLLIVKSDMQK